MEVTEKLIGVSLEQFRAFTTQQQVDHLIDTDTAYHEAGHVVMNFIEHRAIKRVSIVPAKDSAGRVKHNLLSATFHPGIRVETRNRKRIEGVVKIGLAGLATDYIRTGVRHRSKKLTDIQAVRTALSYLTHEAKEAKAYYDLLWYRTVNTLSEPWWWCCIEALVLELLEQKEITGSHARRTMKEALDRYYSGEFPRPEMPPYIPAPFHDMWKPEHWPKKESQLTQEIG